ncbi:DUF4262 domain-containing protein [Cellulomonas hominis]|uniref:DUF4262 domain-containing protein n=1 Tax=Cellulomonas hominis TaxID=156981 RepID=A0A7Z8JY69_9CELL|nr:DUF4262 domain-containing protein [Cellulomonas hominis]TKR22511.1 DUF4262 domain-containing protein [Cellulomonas hominis]
MDEVEAVGWLSHLLGMADEHGWALQWVGPGDGELQFCYTAGLYRYDLPELIVFGPCQADAARLLNTLGARMRAGNRYVDGDSIDDVWRHARVMEVLDSREHLVMAHPLARATRPLPALQVIYPDRDGRWPWQPGSRIANVPILGIVPDVG